ncbi:MAG: hypothetical protein ITG01_11740 [Comamonas sp.]|nr:hypothetical protein [Comamonas sp.]
MGLREEIKEIAVKDQDGNHHTVKCITTFEGGRLIGGGEVPTGERYVLDDGSLLTGFIGGESFMDKATGRMFKAA